MLYIILIAIIIALAVVAIWLAGWVSALRTERDRDKKEAHILLEQHLQDEFMALKIWNRAQQEIEDLKRQLNDAHVSLELSLQTMEVLDREGSRS